MFSVIAVVVSSLVSDAPITILNLLSKLPNTMPVWSDSKLCVKLAVVEYKNSPVLEVPKSMSMSVTEDNNFGDSLNICANLLSASMGPRHEWRGNRVLIMCSGPKGWQGFSECLLEGVQFRVS